MTDPPEPLRRPFPPRVEGAHPVRTWTHRGRMSPLNRERLDLLGPARAVPEGTLRPEEVFGRVAPLVAEIGCGHGHAAVAYAGAFPGHDLLALDVHAPGIARMLALADEAGVPNLKVMRADAERYLESCVQPGTIDAVHLFFPDPWPKAKHAKRRFIAPQRLDLLASRLVPGGHILVATDQDFYVEHVRQVVAEHGGFTFELAPRPAWRPTVGFEDKGIRAGRTITDLRLTRR